MRRRFHWFKVVEACVIAVLMLITTAVGIAAVFNRVTNTASMTITSSTGETFTAQSNAVNVMVMGRPILGGVPPSVYPDQVSTLTVTCDIGDNAYAYKVLLPTVGCVYIADSLVVTGTTGKILSTVPAGLTVELTPVATPATVTCKYTVKWTAP